MKNQKNITKKLKLILIRDGSGDSALISVTENEILASAIHHNALQCNENVPIAQLDGNIINQKMGNEWNWDELKTKIVKHAKICTDWEKEPVEKHFAHFLHN